MMDKYPHRTVLSPKLHKGDEECWNGHYIHYCPGCHHTHIFAIDKPFANGAKWGYNGNPDKPTFTPSMNITWPDPDKPGTNIKQCHYNITDGMITFHSDCTHELKGQTVELPDIPDHS